MWVTVTSSDYLPARNQQSLDTARLICLRFNSAYYTTIPFELSSCQGYSNLFQGVPAHIDWTQIRDWIRICDSNHTGCSGTGLSSVSLDVVDCYNRQVVKLPCSTTRYVALSYVVC